MSSRALVWQHRLEATTPVYSRRGRAATRSGSIFTLPQDKFAASEQLNTEILNLARSVVTAAGGDSALLPRTHAEAIASHPPDWLARVVDSHDAIKKSPLASLWYDTVAPFLSEWQAFYDEHSHWFDAFRVETTSMDTYQHWFDRLTALREAVEAHHVKLGPKAVKPPGDLLDDLKAGVGDIWSILKIALYVALGLAGLFALVFIVKEFRS